MNKQRFFEDFSEGEVIDLGSHTLTRDEIVAFASEYDPQPMHIDERSAAETIVGGLIASGWHTCALIMRMMCDAFLLDSRSMGAPGVEDLRWLKPVRPGDTISATATVLSTRVSARRPDMGIVTIRFDAVNQVGEPVLSMTTPMLQGLRQPKPAEAGA